ncbi:protein bric-a-brac 2-like [Ctenocephalides felis]|uniref:protein bric-a-brac 2-like n=1 Tax=Ctenocephalides felis TaxID=7515 RepID=UPI000E6E2679|nr:protein bric-a-brac 2-like [Ctenocephalides felis]
MSSTKNLIWDDYSKDIESGFCEIFKTGLLHDVTLTSEGQKITAHKLILALSSQHFKDLFSDNSSQNQNTIVFVGNVSFRVLKILVEFMYTGEVTVPENLLEEVLKGAEILNIKALIPKNVTNTETNTDVSSESTECKRSKRVSKIPFRYQSDDILPKKKKYDEPEVNPILYVDINGSNVDSEIQKKGLYDVNDTNSHQDDTDHLSLEASEGFDDPEINDINLSDIKLEEDDKSNIAALNPTGASSLKYIRNKNGNFCLVVNDHIYMKQAIHKERVFWRCQMYSRMACKSRCVTVGNVIVRKVAMHSHAPQTDKVIECEINGDIVYM